MSIILHDPTSFVVPEPRLSHMASLLQQILQVVELEHQGQPVAVDGFRLRDLEMWRSHTTNTAMNALTPISSVCNSRCQFCFEENVPYARERSLMSVAEAETRLRYFDPADGSGLFPSNRNHMETFVHPEAVSIIEMARRRDPGKVFWITTNGSHFTEQTVARLARLGPLIFKLSLNSANADVNRELMKTGALTETAINAPRLLQKYGLPYVGGIVAWPTLSLDDIAETARYLDRHDAYSIRIRLPLTHKWLNHQMAVDFDAHWRQVGDFAHALRREVATPIIVEPPLYWLDPIVPEIDGVIRRSPAALAGLRAGDLVRAIDGRPVRTRVESEALLDRLHMAKRAEVEVEVERDGRRLRVVLRDDPAVTAYPYSSDGFFRGENYGILHIEDFRLNHIQKAIDTIDRHGARNVLLFSSAIMAPVFQTIVAAVPEFRDRLEPVNLYVATIDDNSFGGNYHLMDSRIVADYERVVRRHVESGLPVDLVLVPNAFGSEWGTDVYGRSLSELTMRFGVPVEQIDWLMVYGRDV